jgi:dihydroxy-acid dehydratase
MVRENIRPRDILTLSAFHNAIALDMAIGGSSNTVLHLLAIASEAGVPLRIEDFDEISTRVPNIVKLSPGGTHRLFDLYVSGGISAVLKQMADAGLLNLESKTVTGKSLGENISNASVRNKEVIRPFDDPYSNEGGIAILKGNLAPDGAVVKQSAVAREMLKHSGPARVYDSEEEAFEAIMEGQINKGDVVIIRYEGPKGGPGMREMLSPTSSITGMGLDKDVALITDGRFSGGTRGASIGHFRLGLRGRLSPAAGRRYHRDRHPQPRLKRQAYRRGLAARRNNWKKPAPKVTGKSYLARYSALVTSASTGAVMKTPE